MTPLATHLGAFLREYLPRDRRASPRTVESYAYAFQMLACFASERLGVRPCNLVVEQLTAPLVLDFLDALQRERGNSVSTRNARLAAIKSFFRYLEYRVPACLDIAGQIHAVPPKRGDLPLIDYLDSDEVQSLLDAPDAGTRAGVRDRAMLHLAYAAGLRVSEVTGLLCTDLDAALDTVLVRGKGRRQRRLPLWKQTRAVLRGWLAVRPAGADEHLFLNSRGFAMSRHGFAHRLALHVERLSAGTGVARGRRPRVQGPAGGARRANAPWINVPPRSPGTPRRTQATLTPVVLTHPVVHR